ncbi:hypothetical protein ETAA8_08360 [Anatilimnocola aggregata]|uniref:Uncharacterized protein n=1 Tax=Anatilimnocola aggregata TaxID=2528021 RepID=A0A517Y6A9_9BACT|nr:GEVED domain-containing protein [Anatilimnocola aggregata]QDU25765.1 hypothetical protein ETAA8_08360 [Anatilimnocola aggregata]
MSTRRSLKQTKASLKNSWQKSSQYKEMLRRAARKFHLESLEDRRVFAVDPVLVAADGGVTFSSGPTPTVRNESPRELTFTFPGVPGMDRTTLAAGIRLVPANGDGTFDPLDLPIAPAYLDLGDDATQVVMRFATPLKDDLYQLQFVGTTLKDTSGIQFNAGNTFNLNFTLNLAPQVLAVVPQPVVRNAAGALAQIGNEVHVYFNNDDLDEALAEDVRYYKLLVTRGTVDPSDDAPAAGEIQPYSAVYDATLNKVVLKFDLNPAAPDPNFRLEQFAGTAPGVADPAVSFRLRLGTTEVRRPNVYGTTGGTSNTDWLTKDPGSSFDSAAGLRDVLINGLPAGVPLQSLEDFINSTAAANTGNPIVMTSGTSVIIGQSIDPQFYNLMWPGGNDDPGHRDITGQGNHPGTGAAVVINGRVQTVIQRSDGPENHLGNMIAQNPLLQPAADADSVNGVTTYYYNFRSELGYVPDTTNSTIPTQPTFNVITDRQKQRAREVLEIIGQTSGVNFVETENQGFIIATGDMRAILTLVQTGPGGLTGLAGAVDLNNDGFGETAAAIMDSGDDWSSNGRDLYGNAWFITAMHEISTLLGLGHSYDLPGTTVQGEDPSLAASVPAAEPIFPGDNNIAHMQHVYRPEAKDIDMYKFEVDVAGVLTAETFAERLANSSGLDTAIAVYRVNPDTGVPELYAKNDDYFSKDSFLELTLEANTTYYVGVSASGNTEFDPNVVDSGIGGTTQGAYQLKLDFRKIATDTLTDVSGTPLDGDSDGKPGGVNNFWFRAAAPVSSLADLQNTTRTARTIFVDRMAAADISPRDGVPDSAAYIPDGSLAKPFISIKSALAASRPFDIIRVVGNNLENAADSLDAIDTNLTDNLAYQIGFDKLGNPLADGATLDVPKDRTLVFDAGVVVQLRRAQISVGSENQGASADRSGGALQVLGTPFQSVYFTSYNPTNATEPQIGDSTFQRANPSGELADEGDWGGIAFRSDIDRADGRSDFERRGIFLNYISHADIRYGGGQVVVNSQPRTVNPIHMTDARPTIINSRITLGADAAMSANPDSFEESNFTSPQYGSTFNSSFNVDYKRVGPEIHGNFLDTNTINGIVIRSTTQSGALNASSIEEMAVAGRFDDTDIVHVFQENLAMHSAPGGAFVHTALTAPATTLTVAAPVAGTGGFATTDTNIEYKIVYVDVNGNEGVASSTIRASGSITSANSHIRLTNLPNVTAALLASGFVGRRLYRRIGGVGDFILVEQIPASAAATYVDRNLALPVSALRLKVASVGDSVSPRINAIGTTPAVTTTTSASGGTYTGGQQVVYALAYVDTEGRESPMVELPQVTTLGPAGSVTLNNLPLAYGSYMGLRIYRSITVPGVPLVPGQFDLIGMTDAGKTSFTDTGIAVNPAQLIPATVNINTAVSAVPAPAGTRGFTNGTIVNYRFSFVGTGGESATSALAVPAGETGGFVISGNNRQITLTNLPLVDTKVYSSLIVYRSDNYGKFEQLAIIPGGPGQLTTIVDENFRTSANARYVTNPLLWPRGDGLPVFLQDVALAQPANARARPHGSLVIDPSMVLKFDGARIDVNIGTGLIAEGVKGRDIVLTSLYDTRYGAGGTFATSKSVGAVGQEGDWGGIYFAPDSKGSFNEVVFAYGGGEGRIEGTFAGVNVLEIQQAKVRVANSRFEFNASGASGSQTTGDRAGRGTNDNATIFVRGAQPVIINNTALSNSGAFISINVNALNSQQLTDFGRQTGLLAERPADTELARNSFPVSRLIDTQTGVTDVDNNGPLIRLNRIDLNDTNGMRVRGGVLTTESVWDDTDIAHVLFDSILIPDFHTYGGLRLESSARESLVIKAASNTTTNTLAGIIADGRPLENEERIGGTLQVLGQPGFPVVLTSYADDTISSGFTPAGKPQGNTNGDDPATTNTLPTGPEVDNGVRIDNDVATSVNGHFSWTVGVAGGYGNASTATAQGLTAQFIAQDFIFAHFPVVYAGTQVINLRLATAASTTNTLTMAPMLVSPDVVVSEGQFTRTGLPAVRWRATSSFANGSTRLVTSFDFSTATGAPLGDIRLMSYLDQDVQGANDDLLYIDGSPGAADFRLVTLDNNERIGFSQGGIYTTGAGLQNASYVGFAADKWSDLQTRMLAGTLNNFAITPSGTNIDLVDLPLIPDATLGNVYGLGDITTALAWDLDPLASTSTVTTFLEFLANAPISGGRPGDWNGIVIDKYANDRNVETVPEREPVTSNGTQNSRPNKAQFLGSLSSADKGGDENLRLGFVVQGAIATPGDVDIYSFKAKAETEVWFDIDRTTQSLDTVIELVDEFGNIQARSDNSADEATGADSLLGEGAFPLQKTAPFEGQDLYSTNPRDAGMRVRLTGTPGVESTYFVRIRSVPKNKGDLDTVVPSSVSESLVVPGISSGSYELQVRLRERDEKGGTTIRYAKIANARTGIDVNGHPSHSPLTGERRDIEPNNTGSLAGAQNLGNLLAVDRGAISISGNLNALGDVDWYRFTLDYNAIDGQSPVPKEYPNFDTLVNTVFDLDYADGLGRPNLQLFVYNSNFQLILTNFDSNVSDDRSGTLSSSGISDLNRGSVGTNDAYIGNIALPATAPLSSLNGTAPETYYVAVAAVGTIPTPYTQFTSATTTNPLLRIEPIDSVHRIVEDHINEGRFEDIPWRQGKPPDRGTSSLPDTQVLFDNIPGNDSVIPWHLGDMTLYISRDSAATEVTTLQTINPFTGAHVATVGTQGFDIEDIAFNTANNLFGLSRDLEDTLIQDSEAGHLIQINTGTGAPTDLGDDGIDTYQPDAMGNPIVTNAGNGFGVHYNALEFFTPNNSPERLLAIGNRGEFYRPGNINPTINSKQNIIYQLNPANGAALVNGGPRLTGAGTDAFEVGEILTQQRFTGVEATISTGANYFANITDGTFFTVTDGNVTRDFEFNAGFEATQQVNLGLDQTVRDGYYFILDRDDVPKSGNEVIFQFDTGSVIAVNPTINSTAAGLDGSTFTINAAGQQRVFEFDNNAVQNSPGALPIDIRNLAGPFLTADVIAARIQAAINAASGPTFQTTALVAAGSTRVSLIPFLPTQSVSVTAINPSLSGLVAVEGETGQAPILQAVDAPLALQSGDLEGQRFSLTLGNPVTPANTFFFEFDPAGNGVTAGSTPVNINYGDTSDVVAVRMRDAIRTVNGLFADVYGGDDRVVANGFRIAYNVLPGTPIVNLLGPVPQGGLPNVLMATEEVNTNAQIATSILNAVNLSPISPFTAGAEGATLDARINFPPVTAAGKVPTLAVDFDGMPIWTQLASTPDFSPGAYSIPFRAEDSAATIATSVANAINADLNSAGIFASLLGNNVQLTSGQIITPANSPFIVGGQGPGGSITGMVNVANTAATSTFVAVSDNGGLYEFTINFLNNQNLLPTDPNKILQVTSVNYIGASRSDLAGLSIQGLTRGPATVENGRYANTWFAVAEVGGQSRLYAFEYDHTTDTYGGMEPIFVDGQTNIPLTFRNDAGVVTPITQANGIRFGQLNENLWGFTPFVDPTNTHRQTDAGHGTPAAENGSRPATTGNSSLYFGTGGRGSTYNVNGGAFGSVVSNEFNLEGYAAVDQPALYFTYFSSQEASPIYDSLRVFVSSIDNNNADTNGDGVADSNSGDWQLLAMDESNIFINTNGFRQVRIPLDAYAGQKSVRLRVDFSTAGDMDVGVPYTTGEELRAVAGQYITDEQFISIGGQRYEFNNGVTATFSSGRATPDGETITILPTAAGVPITFEFDKNNSVTAGNIRVGITDLMTAQELTQTLLGVLAANGLGAGTSYLGNDSVLNFFTAAAVTPAAAPTSAAAVTQTQGAAGLSAAGLLVNAIELPFTRTQSRDTVATTLQNMLVQTFYAQKLIVQDGSQYNDEQTFRLTATSGTADAATYEFDSGEIFTIPTAGANPLAAVAITDGDSFQITWNGVPRIFEYDNNLATVILGAIPISFNVNDSQSQVASATVAVLNSALGGNMNAAVVSGSAIQLDTDTNALTIADFTNIFGSPEFASTGAAGVAVGNIPVFYTDSASFLPNQVAGRVAQALNAGGPLAIPGLAATTSPTSPNRVELVSARDFSLSFPGPLNALISLETPDSGSIKQYGDLVRLISSPTGPFHTVDVVGGVAQRGPFGLETNLTGDVTDTVGGFRSNLRYQNNAFEGVYLDDFVIGLAERGEMLSNAISSSAITIPTTPPPGQIILGDYQLEIRRGVGYDFVTPALPGFTPDSNDRFSEQQTLLARSGAQLIDGQTFTISDGTRQLTFEFNDTAEVTPFGQTVVTPGNQEIPFNSTMSAPEVALSIRDAINSTDVQQILRVNAWLGDGTQPGLATTTNRVNLNGAATFVATGVPVKEVNESLDTALQITAPGSIYDGLRFFANGTVGDSDDTTTEQKDADRRARDIDYFGLDLSVTAEFFDGLTTADRETVTVLDPTVSATPFIFEFDNNGLTTLGNIAVPITPAMTRVEVMQAFQSALATAGLSANVVVDAQLPATLRFQGTQTVSAAPAVIGGAPITRVVGQQILVDVDAAIQGSTLDSYLRIFNAAGTLQTVTINGNTYTAENDGATVRMIPTAGGPAVTIAAPGERLGNTQVRGSSFATRPDTDSYLAFSAPSAGRYYIAVSGAGNNKYTHTTTAGAIIPVGAIPGSTGKYTLEVTSPNAPNSNSAGAPSAIDVITFDQELGDRNLVRDQGQIVLQGNEVYNSLFFGIDIDAGARVAADGNAAHQGATRNLSQANTVGLVPGVVVMNNIIYGNGTGGIRFSGDPGTDAPVSFGRIINNTLYGKGGTFDPPSAAVADTGILVNERSGPTLLNNIIANFATALNVDASSRPNTVIGGLVTQGNTVLTNPANLGLGDFPIMLTNADPLFKNAQGGNFYLAALSPAIDSSIDSLLDRPLMVSIKSPLGLGDSPILTPDRDARGQVRADDPDVQTPQGFGLNPFKDRGALDRVDKSGPSSALVNPQDNDALGIDRDQALTVVSTDNTVLVRNFTIALFDRTDPNGEPDGSDIDDFTVTSSQVIVTRRISTTATQVLVEGVDYFFSYDATSNQIVLTPVGNIWPRGTYQILMNDGIADQAGNLLSPNNTVAIPNPNVPGDTINHYYTLFLGTAVDYGDAPASYPVLDADGGANHGIEPGVYLGTDPTGFPTADFDGQPSVAANLDNDDGVQFISLQSGIADGGRVIVTSPRAGLIVSAWINLNPSTDSDWSDAGEQILTNVVLAAGSNLLNFTMPASERGATYARFRVSTEVINSPTGAAIDGEVEDYQVTLTGPLFQNDPNDIQVTYPGDLTATNVGQYDVDDNGKINAFDALIIINYLNSYGVQNLPIVSPPAPLNPLLNPPPFLDVNGDGRLTAFDAIGVITHLNRVPLLPPVIASAGEDVGFTSMRSTENEANVDGEVLDANLSLHTLVPDVMYASSSVVIETAPTTTATASVPVSELVQDAAVELLINSMAVAQGEHEDPSSFETFEQTDEAMGPLTDAQWSDLLSDLAEEQLNLG